MIEIAKVGSEFRVNTQTIYAQLNPEITGLANGGFVVTWQNLGGKYAADASTSIDGIYAQVYDANGASVGGELLVGTSAIRPQSTPGITALADSSFVVTWWELDTLSDNSLVSNVKAQIYAADGTKLGSEIAVANAGDGLAVAIAGDGPVNPKAIALANGSFVVTWTAVTVMSDSTVHNEIRAQLFGFDGTKLGSDFAVSTDTVDDKGEATVTGLANGGFVVTWHDHDTSGVLGDNSGYSVHAQVYDASGAVQGGPFLVNTETASDQSVPKVTGLAGGGFVITWQDTSMTGGDGSDTSIKAQMFDANGEKQGGEFLINTLTYQGQSAPTISALETGGFVVAWLYTNNGESVDTRYNIKAQVFDAAGQKEGHEFLVNTVIAGAQFSPTITGLANGGFAVSWSDQSGTMGDTDYSSIKAQVFAINVFPDITGTSDSNTLTGSAGGEKIFGLAGNDALSGLGGNDLLFGGDGNDRLDGGAGTDRMEGGAGDDTYVIDASSDLVVEEAGAGTDTVETAFARYVLAGNLENLTFTGDAAHVGFGNALNNSITGRDGNDILTGLAGDDILSGFGGNDDLRGGDGNDWLDGGAGVDRMQGGAGDDTYFVYETGDRVIEKTGSGNDTVMTSLAHFVLGSNVENLTFVSKGAHTGSGNALDNHINGGNDNDVLDGRAGADVLEGGDGHDLYYVDNVGDVVVEYADNGTDSVSSTVSYVLPDEVENLTLRSSKAALDLTGNASNNMLWGNSNANVILGLGGDDVIFGGKGNDTLTGGSGADSFLFLTQPNTRSNLDTVTDFVSGTDKLVFDKTVFTAFTASGAIDTGAFHAGAGVNAAHDASDRFIYNTSTDALWYDADGTGGTKAVEVAVLGGHPALAFSDILIAA